MIQVHGKTILSMEFKFIIKAHDLNPWQFIYPKPNSHWQYQSLILIGNIKAQFSLAILKPNSHWQHQSLILIGNIKAQFSLATSKPSSRQQYLKPNSHQQYQNPILIGNIKSSTYVGTIKKPKLITWHYFIESPRLSILGKILHRNYFT